MTERFPTATNSSDTCKCRSILWPVAPSIKGTDITHFFFTHKCTEIATTQWKKRVKSCVQQWQEANEKRLLSCFISEWVKRLKWSRSQLWLDPTGTELPTMGLTGISTPCDHFQGGNRQRWCFTRPNVITCLFLFLKNEFLTPNWHDCSV